MGDSERWIGSWKPDLAPSRGARCFVGDLRRFVEIAEALGEPRTAPILTDLPLPQPVTAQGEGT
jgi:hypothetical protein